MNATCPCCNAPLRYDSGQSELRCESCGNSFEVEAMQRVDDALAQATQASDMTWQRDEQAGTWSQEEQDSLRAYQCPSCGAEIVADDTTAATQCVYCGNPSILPGNLSGDFRPEAVIPFEKAKDEAKAKYKGFLKGKRLLPNDFITGNRIEEITGVYVPFWVFDCDAEANMVFRAQRSRTRTSGDMEITTTEHYLAIREGSLGFDQIPVDGSSKFQDALMEAIEPYDAGKTKAFSSAYLPGYQAERYDVEADQAKPRADERVQESVQATFAGTVQGYQSVQQQSARITLSGGKVRNVLYPVWMLNTRWQGKTYSFAMNGQTGKFVGNLPIAKGKAVQWALGLFVGSFAVIAGVAYAVFAMGGL